MKVLSIFIGTLDTEIPRHDDLEIQKNDIRFGFNNECDNQFKSLESWLLRNLESFK